MLKTALICSVACAAFLVGDRTPVAPQGKPVPLHEVLRPYVGKHCFVGPKTSGTYWVSFEANMTKNKLLKFDMLGVDFIRVSNKEGMTLIPFSSISAIDTD